MEAPRVVVSIRLRKWDVAMRGFNQSSRLKESPLLHTFCAKEELIRMAEKSADGPGEPPSVAGLSIASTANAGSLVLPIAPHARH